METIYAIYDSLIKPSREINYSVTQSKYSLQKEKWRNYLHQIIVFTTLMPQYHCCIFIFSVQVNLNSSTMVVTLHCYLVLQLCSHQASLFTITGNQTLCIIEYLLKMKTIANSLIAATQPISQEDFVLAYSCWISTKHDSFINSVTTHGEPISADDLHQWRSHMVPREKWKPKQS